MLVLLLITVAIIFYLVYLNKYSEGLNYITFPTGIKKTYISPNKILNNCSPCWNVGGDLTVGMYQ